MSIWIDIDDLIQYFDTGCRPSGIQRLSFELTSALVEAGGSQIRVCRHAHGTNGFVELDWSACKDRLQSLMGRGDAVGIPASECPPEPPQLPVSRLRRLVRRLPNDLRAPLVSLYLTERDAAIDFRHAIRAQLQALRCCCRLAANAWRHVRSSMARQQRVEPPGRPARSGHERPAIFAAGDVLLAIGATWQFSSYEARINKLRAQGVRFAPFVHDMVPLLFPEWSVRLTTDAFECWVRTVLTRADFLFTNSMATQRDVARYAEKQHLPIPQAIPIPIGATFSRRATAAAPKLHPRPYILFVSTIEPRKNHAGMLRLWREMIAHEPPDLVPDLVFAGRVGWLAEDVIAQARNARWFDGRVRLIESPTDEQLACLYRDCMFTVYPSFYEGWGLPVTESLGFGKLVAASNRASIPEAGDRFCVYFDPDDLGDARRVIGGLIRDPERRAALEAEIARRYRPPSWHDGARAMLDALSGLAPASVRSSPPAPVKVFSAAILSSPTS